MKAGCNFQSGFAMRKTLCIVVIAAIALIMIVQLGPSLIWH
jgi:hypothetical protein